MSEVEQGNEGPSVDGSGIIRTMSEGGRKALARAVRRHREYRGWSRPQMSKAAQALAESKETVLSDSTIKNVENEDGPSLEAKTAQMIERVLGWPVGTVAQVLNGVEAPEVTVSAEEVAESENSTSWEQFKTWPDDVQDSAMLLGGLLSVVTTPERRLAISDAAAKLIMDMSRRPSGG